MRHVHTLLALTLLWTVSFAGCKSGDDMPTGPSNPGSSTAAFAYLAGNWSGTWTDTRYNVSGTLQATFTVTSSAVTATGTIGLASLGLGNETGTATATVSGDTLMFTFISNTVGSGSGTLAATGGTGGGSGTVTGVLNLGAFTFTGAGSAAGIQGAFNFTSPTGGNGVASLTKQ